MIVVKKKFLHNFLFFFSSNLFTGFSLFFSQVNLPFLTLGYLGNFLRGTIIFNFIFFFLSLRRYYWFFFEQSASLYNKVFFINARVKVALILSPILQQLNCFFLNGIWQSGLFYRTLLFPDGVFVLNSYRCHLVFPEIFTLKFISGAISSNKFNMLGCYFATVVQEFSFLQKYYVYITSRCFFFGFIVFLRKTLLSLKFLSIRYLFKGLIFRKFKLMTDIWQPQLLKRINKYAFNRKQKLFSINRDYSRLKYMYFFPFFSILKFFSFSSSNFFFKRIRFFFSKIRRLFPVATIISKRRRIRKRRILYKIQQPLLIFFRKFSPLLYSKLFQSKFFFSFFLYRFFFFFFFRFILFSTFPFFFFLFFFYPIFLYIQLFLPITFFSFKKLTKKRLFFFFGFFTSYIKKKYSKFFFFRFLPLKLLLRPAYFYNQYFMISPSPFFLYFNTIFKFFSTFFLSKKLLRFLRYKHLFYRRKHFFFLLQCSVIRKKKKQNARFKESWFNHES